MKVLMMIGGYALVVACSWNIGTWHFTGVMFGCALMLDASRRMHH